MMGQGCDRPLEETLGSWLWSILIEKMVGSAAWGPG
jgi:hypothetical protein